MLTSLVKALSCAAVAIAFTATVQAADISGSYSWSQPGRGGGDPVKRTLTLKQDGDKITGTFPAMGGRGGGGGGGGAPAGLEIKDAKLKGDELTFSTTRETQNGSQTIKYTGKVSGDTIKLSWEQPGRGGGDPQKREVEAKKEAAK